ncbi:hypothetical protein [Nocardia miyunensis]|uniref:hypothetical protein n=1 Tax=Nocardia miyunensis TaxID=282684 RepID=UPI000836C86D|nr:hypothetical protein [Nocardia miyunensis]
MGIAEFDEKGRLRRTHIIIRGRDPETSARLYKQMLDSTMKAAARRSPWLSGSFYLVAALVILSVLLVIARLTPVWTVPVVVVGGVLLLSVVGAFQLRQDDALSEEGFLTLMISVLGKLPAMLRRNKGVETIASLPEGTEVECAGLDLSPEDIAALERQMTDSLEQLAEDDSEAPSDDEASSR